MRRRIKRLWPFAAAVVVAGACAAAPRASISGAPAAAAPTSAAVLSAVPGPTPGAGTRVERVEELPASAASRACARRVRVAGGREYVLAGFSVTRVDTLDVAAGVARSGDGTAVGTYAPAPPDTAGPRVRVDCGASRVVGAAGT